MVSIPSISARRLGLILTMFVKRSSWAFLRLFPKNLLSSIGRISRTSKRCPRYFRASSSDGPEVWDRRRGHYLMSELIHFVDAGLFFCAEDVIRNKAMLFNCLVLNQGEHKLIYDLETLKRMLETVGFRDVVAYPYTYSDDSMFKGMDNHGYLYIGEVSLCIEATK